MYSWVVSYTEFRLIRIFSAALRFICYYFKKIKLQIKPTELESQDQVNFGQYCASERYLQVSHTAMRCFDLLYKHSWHENIWTKKATHYNRLNFMLMLLSCLSYWDTGKVISLLYSSVCPLHDHQPVLAELLWSFVVNCKCFSKSQMFMKPSNPRCCWKVRRDLMKHADYFWA